jgi:hypothetical protein
MLKKLNQRKRNIKNFKSLKYTVIPTPSCLRSDFLILLLQLCQPVLVPNKGYL